MNVLIPAATRQRVLAFIDSPETRQVFAHPEIERVLRESCEQAARLALERSESRQVSAQVSLVPVSV
jgi:hypothetical protein